ncbi:hypothetical protein P7M41_26870, partial [Vibrio parahaemolyticus]|nr:hypothetical protein [Vibrio parahaemolyticus]
KCLAPSNQIRRKRHKTETFSHLSPLHSVLCAGYGRKDIFILFFLNFYFIFCLFYFSVFLPEGLPPYCGQGVCVPQ